MADTRQNAVADSLGALFALTTRTTEAVGPALEAHGLTFNTAYLLWMLDPEVPAPPMRAVAERMHCTPSNLTFLADQLETRGFVERVPSPDDGRRRVLALTARGATIRQDVVSALVESCPLTRLDDDEVETLRRVTSTALALT